MSTFRHPRSFAALLFAGVVTLAACGGDTATDAPADAEAAEAPAAESPSDVPDDFEDAPDGMSAFCLEIYQDMAAAQQAYAEATASLMGGSSDPADFEAAAAGMEAMAQAAPAEIRADFEVLTGELASYFRALAQVGFDPGEQPTPEQMEQMAEIAGSMDVDALEEANQNIEAFFDEHC